MRPEIEPMLMIEPEPRFAISVGDRLAGFPDRLEVHGEQPSPLLIGDLESLDVKTDPCVVDQDVDGSESALNGADHAENVVPLRQIRPDCEGAGAELFKLRDGLSVSLFVTRSDRDGRSRFGQSDGDRAADAAVSSGDQCDFAAH